jgi:hypothetical protein
MQWEIRSIIGRDWVNGKSKLINEKGIGFIIRIELVTDFNEKIKHCVPRERFERKKLQQINFCVYPASWAIVQETGQGRGLRWSEESAEQWSPPRCWLKRDCLVKNLIEHGIWRNWTWRAEMIWRVSWAMITTTMLAKGRVCHYFVKNLIKLSIWRNWNWTVKHKVVSSVLRNTELTDTIATHHFKLKILWRLMRKAGILILWPRLFCLLLTFATGEHWLHMYFPPLFGQVTYIFTEYEHATKN